MSDKLPQWKDGDLISASKMNAMVDAINNMEGGDGEVDLSGYVTEAELNTKQDKLVSGTNIKTINGQSILGSGDINIEGGSSESDEPSWNFTSDYQTELDSVISKVRAIQSNDKKFHTEFIMFTDIHKNTVSAHPEFGRMMQAIKYLSTNLDIKFVASLGDNIDTPVEGSNYGVYTELQDALEDLPVPYINIMGNHDWVASVYKRNFATNIQNAVFDKVGAWFYVDDEMHDLRYIILDCQDRGNDANAWTTVTTANSAVTDRSWQQLDWLANVALKTKKKVIFIGHQSLGSNQKNVIASTSNTDNYFIASQIAQDFEAGIAGSANYTKYYPAETTAKDKVEWDFSEQGSGVVLCNFHGHVHGDLFWNKNTSNPSPFNEIAFDDAIYNTATYIGTNNTKQLNSVNEIAFDVVSVDLLGNIVSCYRFGTGEDRVCNLIFNNYESIADLSINIPSEYAGLELTPTVNYTPSGVANSGVVWSLEYGSSYANIDANTGLISFNSIANNNEIKVRATSVDKPNIYDEACMLITFKSPSVLTSIKITNPPIKINYTEGESFSTSGMAVTAYYEDGSSRRVNNYSYEPVGGLVLSDTEITIIYSEGGITRTTTQVVVVEERPKKDVDITSQFTFTTGGPVGYASGVGFNEPGGDTNPGSNPNLCYSNYVDISEYKTLSMTIVTRNGNGPTGGWCFYTTADTTGFISEGANQRNGNNKTDGVATMAITIPAGAKYIRTTYWSSNSPLSATPFSCVGHRE